MNLLDEIKAQMPFFHNFTLEDGTRTRPKDGNEWNENYPENLWEIVKEFVPDDLHGAVCLDIGCNAGGLSFKLDERGGLVVGIDPEQDGNPDFKDAIKKAKLMNEYLGRRCAFEKADFLKATNSGVFDLILFLGVYYHLPDHTLAMPKLASLVKTGGTVVIESAFSEQPERYGGEKVYHGDVTNHFVPSIDYLRADIERNGFRIEGQKTFHKDRVVMKAVKEHNEIKGGGR